MTVNDRVLKIFHDHPNQSFRVCDIQEKIGFYSKQSIKHAIRIIKKENPSIVKVKEGNRGSAAHSSHWAYIKPHNGE